MQPFLGEHVWQTLGFYEIWMENCDADDQSKQLYPIVLVSHCDVTSSKFYSVVFLCRYSQVGLLGIFETFFLLL